MSGISKKYALFNFLTVVVIVGLCIFSVYIGWKLARNSSQQVKSSSYQALSTPLAKYSIENLSQKPPKPGKFESIKTLEESDKFFSNLFSFEFNPEVESGKDQSLKKTTGLINIPKQKGTFPLILVIRGYVDQEIYETGMGTKKVGEYFASNGFITIAPDFLGYAGSDSEANNIFESRFQTYVTILSMLSTIDTLDSSLISLTQGKWNKKDLFLWGHSNGGQIAIATLESTGMQIPTVLWAPVTKPFPYSILYYTDESEDRGKLIRSELAKFENLYNADQFSIDNYLEKINAPLELHQGTADDAVPANWSDEFVAKLKKLNKDITYFRYPGADHNLIPDWNVAVQRNLEFFQRHTQK